MGDKKKDVTIHDLAQELKVSPSTVSRALNDHHSIGKKTKKAVRELAKKRGYRPNTIASSLRTNRPLVSRMVLLTALARPFPRQVVSLQLVALAASPAVQVAPYWKSTRDRRVPALSVLSMALGATKNNSDHDIPAAVSSIMVQLYSVSRSSETPEPSVPSCLRLRASPQFVSTDGSEKYSHDSRVAVLAAALSYVSLVVRVGLTHALCRPVHCACL